MRWCNERNWIASSLLLLAMTDEVVEKPVEGLWKTGG